jgi:hypothetical protein
MTESRTERLTGVYVEKSSRADPRWVAVWVGRLVTHDRLPLTQSRSTHEEATAWALAHPPSGGKPEKPRGRWNWATQRVEAI